MAVFERHWTVQSGLSSTPVPGEVRAIECRHCSTDLRRNEKRDYSVELLRAKTREIIEKMGVTSNTSDVFPELHYENTPDVTYLLFPESAARW